MTSQQNCVIKDIQSKTEIIVKIDGIETKVKEGVTVLKAAERLGIHIPTLCHHDDLRDVGVCRICLVEIEGMNNLQPSCTYTITRPISVRTNTPRIREARRMILELMLYRHFGDCTSCVRSRNCELLNLARDYGVDTSFIGRPKEIRYEKDMSGYSIVRDMNKCILCQRCTRTCEDLQEVNAIGVMGRGRDVRISTAFDLPLGNTICINCGQCINRCPTGALQTHDYTDEVWAAISDPNKYVIIQTAPAPRSAIGEEFGLAPGTAMTWQLNTALRRCGFDKVFDTNFTADLTIIEEGTELILRLYKNLVKKDNSLPLPQFTSCSPGWIKYIEHFYPEYLDHVSTCKSPQQMFGALLKTYFAKANNIDPANIVSVALMPCTAKKFECNRPEMRASGFKDVDYGLTTRELARMIKMAGINLPEMPESDFDDPFGTASGSGVIFGATGGVMEAALRTVLELITGKKVDNFYENANIIPVRGFEGCRYLELSIPKEVGQVPDLIKHLVPDWNWIAGATLKIGVAHGTANAKKVMEDIKNGGRFSECHFIEFMACPGGCLGGGGQPIPTSQSIREARAKVIYAEDIAYGNSGRARKSHENPAVLRLYSEFLTEGPCGHKSHHLLHTKYTKRNSPWSVGKVNEVNL